MSKSARICDSSSCHIGRMVCQTCHMPITEGLFLNIDYYVSKRGNEDDYSRQWHQKCSENHPQWEAHRIEVETMEEKQGKRVKADKLKAIDLIKKAWELDIETKEGITTITCVMEAGK